ncbi:hypothetical protein SETIT_8G088000v2 [Setaria italica]|uniref:Uncharacterized protein n=2 Tax=Setaria TaxID=4554 RepID=A0A368S5P6_SETIT|nr:hypothetical protein SETIT_8G088000v2 [Setaria italica]TKW00134.1 hypothetical protein SEVIR_8G089100v2 [Setaria viridis]
MADAQTPGGYFFGRPANYEDNQQPVAADGQNTGSTPGNHGQQQPPASSDQKKAGIFSNLFSCFSGGRAES